MLGKYGAQVYADWISHKVKFDSPQILDAMTIVHNWMQNPAWVNGGYGGVQSIAATTFQNAGYPILKNQCAMLQQASFYEAQWPSWHHGQPERRHLRLQAARGQPGDPHPG